MTNEELLQIIQQAIRDRILSLNLSHNGLKNLPEEIGQLTELTELDLSYNELTRLPTEIGLLSNINSLNISNNKLTIIPQEISQLKNLKNLDLSGNQIKSISPEIAQVFNLNNINLNARQSIDSPSNIDSCSELISLDLRNNPLPLLPPEIRQKATREILNFYRQSLEQSTTYIYEAKLIIIGEGGAGKTTLAQKIINQDYVLREQEYSTEGIEVVKWCFPFKEGKEFRVNIWDFGGQEIYHATHQFFLTERSLYILVVDSRRNDTDFYYWLNIVALLSGKSPLIIIQNEKQDRKREINERQLRGEFTNLKEILSTNLANNQGLPEVLAQIKHYISTLPHIGTALPITWVKVREALEQDRRNYISLNEYLQICQINGFIRREDELQLSRYLHDLGVCLHFQDDELLSRTIILKPNWGTDAVYKVLDSPQIIQNQGKFSSSDLAVIWHEDKYADMRPELLRLMMKFKLCYEIPSRPGTYIAPQLLSPNKPEYNWNESENLLLRYEYAFMPKGILTRLIVEMNNWIENQSSFWKTGIVLNKDGARAEVIELYHKGEIRIRVSGRHQRDLLAVIRHELDKIHSSYERLRYNTLVPCNCSVCKGSQSPHFYQLEILYKFLDAKQFSIQCQNSFEMVSVHGLLGELSPPEETQLMPDLNNILERPKIRRLVLPIGASSKIRDQFHNEIEFLKNNSDWKIIDDQTKEGEEEAIVMIYKDEDYLNNEAAYVLSRSLSAMLKDFHL
jgi:internalin A